MTMFSQKTPFNLAEFLSRPATPSDIKRAAEAKRRHRAFTQKLEDDRAKDGLLKRI